MTVYLFTNIYNTFKDRDTPDQKGARMWKALTVDAGLFVIFSILTVLAVTQHLSLLHGVSQFHLMMGFGAIAVEVLITNLGIIAWRQIRHHLMQPIEEKSVTNISRPLLSKSSSSGVSKEQDGGLAQLSIAEIQDKIIEEPTKLSDSQMTVQCLSLFQHATPGYIIIKNSESPYLLSRVPGFFGRTHYHFGLSIDPAAMSEAIPIILETIAKERVELEGRSYKDLLQINLGVATKAFAEMGPCMDGEIVVNVVVTNQVPDDAHKALLGDLLADIHKELIVHRIKPRKYYSDNSISGSGYFFTNQLDTTPRDLLAGKNIYDVFYYEDGMERDAEFANIPFVPNLCLEKKLLMQQGKNSLDSPLSELPPELFLKISHALSML